jgi:hypothetical protein
MCRVKLSQSRQTTTLVNRNVKAAESSQTLAWPVLRGSTAFWDSSLLHLNDQEAEIAAKAAKYGVRFPSCPAIVSVLQIRPRGMGCFALQVPLDRCGELQYRRKPEVIKPVR